MDRRRYCAFTIVLWQVFTLNTCFLLLRNVAKYYMGILSMEYVLFIDKCRYLNVVEHDLCLKARSSFPFSRKNTAYLITNYDSQNLLFIPLCSSNFFCFFSRTHGII